MPLGGSENLILTGFMGTGKTRVGKALASRLGQDFVDMDQLIEEREGMTIRQIFEQKGEAYFRRLEAELCRELATGTGAPSRSSGLVIATGGGTLLPTLNREILGATGYVVCLTASTDEIVHRMGGAQDRPLLDSARARAQIAALLGERSEAYQQIPMQVDTTGLTVDQVVDRVLAAAEEPTHTQIAVQHPDGWYPVHIGWGLVKQLGALLGEHAQGSRVAIVTNDSVRPLYADAVEASLTESGFRPTIHPIPDGEEFKNLGSVGTLYDGFVEAGLDRHDTVLALGGGVIGDLAGFAAATYLRGVLLVQVPTSLLAMVDASIGGKVAVDHQRGKNLIGAFKQPGMVVIDPGTLASLRSPAFACGVAEILKAGLVGDRALFEQIEKYGPAPLLWLIARAVRVKARIVESDPYERGFRAKLNLGHTFGHALELASEYALSHGEAVSIGLVAACRLSARLGFCEPALAVRVEETLRRVGLPTSSGGYSAEQIRQAMETDKKRRGNRLRFVLIRDVGDVFMTDRVENPDLLSTLEDLSTH